MALDHDGLRWNGWGSADRSGVAPVPDELWGWLAQQLGMRALLATPSRALDDLEIAPSRLSPRDRQILSVLLGPEKVWDDKQERTGHAGGRSYVHLLRLRNGDRSDAPDAVVYPASNEDVLKLLVFASEREIAVVPWGGGANIVGSLAPRHLHRAAITLDLRDMNRVEAVDTKARIARVQTGITCSELENASATHGLMLGHRPDAFEFSTLGGWIAGVADAASQTARDWLLGAEVATPRGMLRDDDLALADTPLRMRDFMVGSRGALGIITGATVRLRPQPVASWAAAYMFRDFESGAAAIQEIARERVPYAVLHLSDADDTRFLDVLHSVGRDPTLRDRMVNLALNVARYEAPCMLTAVFEGTRDTVAHGRRNLSRVVRKHGALPVGSARANRWLQQRFQKPFLRNAMLDNGLGFETIVISTNWYKLSDLYSAARGALQKAIGDTVPRLARGLVLCRTSHFSSQQVNLTFDCIFPRALNDELAQCSALWRAASQVAANCGGTVINSSSTSEGSAGVGKNTLKSAILRAVKDTLDPKGILNPGVLFPR
jgi:alkyldihydroxyacetonephosphate synthase